MYKEDWFMTIDEMKTKIVLLEKEIELAKLQLQLAEIQKIIYVPQYPIYPICPTIDPYPWYHYNHVTCHTGTMGIMSNNCTTLTAR
jgi:hypothetical protein